MASTSYVLISGILYFAQRNTSMNYNSSCYGNSGFTFDGEQTQGQIHQQTEDPVSQPKENGTKRRVRMSGIPDELHEDGKEVHIPDEHDTSEGISQKTIVVCETHGLSIDSQELDTSDAESTLERQIPNGDVDVEEHDLEKQLEELEQLAEKDVQVTGNRESQVSVL